MASSHLARVGTAVAGDVADVVGCLPGMHKTLNLSPSIHKPGVVPMPIRLAFGMWRQED